MTNQISDSKKTKAMFKKPLWKVVSRGALPFAASTYYHLKHRPKHIRYVLEQGASRSGKTYSILFYLIEHAFENKGAGAIYTICRHTLSDLKRSAYLDFIEILKKMDVYNVGLHNKSNYTYQLFGNTFEFREVGDGSGIASTKRNICYIMEASEISATAFNQIAFRTKDVLIIDWNPHEQFWAEDLKSLPNAQFRITTFKDNPFLEASQLSEYERIRISNPDLYRVMALGQYVELKGLVFPNAVQVHSVPEDAKLIGYGHDFGYSNDVSATVAGYILGDDLYLKEMIYETGLDSNATVSKFRAIGIEKTKAIIADSARPEMIATIKQSGFAIFPCQKGKGSVKDGIDRLKRYNIKIVGANLWSERNRYCWKMDNSGNSTNEPIELYNHAWDAARYLITYHLGMIGNSSGGYGATNS
jgi:phage terminase large subunit